VIAQAAPRATRRILVVAGEASGDRHAAGVMLEARRLDPSLEFTGVGGPAMRSAGLSSLFDAESISVVGFLEVIRHLPKLRSAFSACVRALRDGVEALLLVDYPGFNLRLAARAHSLGMPVIYFISPQVWAWKPGRIEKIARVVDRMLVVFPFEEAIYRGRGVDVEYVGHPLVEEARPVLEPARVAAALALDPRRPILGILPGSRSSEIRRNLPPALGAARLLRRFFRDLQLVIPVAPQITEDEIRPLLASHPDLEVTLARRPLNEVLPACRAAIVASGTATLETALLGIPMVVIYKLHPLTAALARRLTVTDTFAMVNIVAGRRLVPECIQEKCTPQAIAREAERYLADPAYHAAAVAGLAEVRSMLGKGDAYANAARSLVSFLEARRGGAARSAEPAPAHGAAGG